MDDMLPASARYLTRVNKRYGKPKPLCDAEQGILDWCLWLEELTGKRRNKAAVVAALAKQPHVINSSDWMTILDKRLLVNFEGLTISLRESGRAKAHIPTVDPTIEALHRLAVENQWGPYSRVLKSLIECYPGSYTRAELAAASDTQLDSFSLDHSLKNLLRQRLIEHKADGRLIASAALFPSAAMS